MRSNVVELKRKQDAVENQTADCWHRIYLIMRQIQDEALREEALSFWRQKAPTVLRSSFGPS